MKTCVECKWFSFLWPSPPDSPFGKCIWARENLPPWVLVAGSDGCRPSDNQAEKCPAFKRDNFEKK